MALQIQIVKIEENPGGVDVYFNVVPSGSYVTGGDTLDFTAAIKDPDFHGIAEQIQAVQGPKQLDVWTSGGNLLFQYYPVKGSTLKNSKVKICASGSFGTELGAGAYPAGVTGDVIEGFAEFARHGGGS